MGNSCNTKQQQSNLEKTVERLPMEVQLPVSHVSAFPGMLSPSHDVSSVLISPFECEAVAINSFSPPRVNGSRFVPAIKPDSITYLSGAVYQGQVVNGMRHGLGVFRDSDGNVFTGDFVDDHICGKGVYKLINGTRYEGDFKDDVQHGKGREVWPDGSVYEGEYKDGVKHGRGRYKFPDGSIFDGEFVEGNICGYVSSPGTPQLPGRIFLRGRVERQQKTRVWPVQIFRRFLLPGQLPKQSEAWTRHVF